MELVPGQNRPFKNATMWSIVQNYAEYQIFQGYNSIINFYRIITFFGISNLSLSRAFTLALKQKEESSPLKDLLAESSDEFDQSSRLVYDWYDTMLDFAFFVVTVAVMGYLAVSILSNILLELRLQNEQMTRETRHICFVCGRSENEIMKDIPGGKGWKDHITKEHNIFSYINYILYIRQKIIDEYIKSKKDATSNTSYVLTPLQQYVLDKVEKGDISFLPRNNTGGKA